MEMLKSCFALHKHAADDGLGLMKRLPKPWRFLRAAVVCSSLGTKCVPSWHMLKEHKLQSVPGL